MSSLPSSRPPLAALAVLALCPLGGCSSSMPPGSATVSFADGKPSPGGAALKADVKPGDAAAPAGQRKIIYTAQVEVVVKNLDAAANEVRGLVDRHKGYFAGSDVRGDAGAVRSASRTRSACLSRRSRRSRTRC